MTNSSNNTDSTACCAHRAGSIAITGLALILATTLFPYDFLDRGAVIGFEYGLSSPWNWKPGIPADLLANILLYIPLGFGLTGLAQKVLKESTLTGLVILLLVLGLSLGIEFLQTHLPSRSPSILDIAANTLGGLAGWRFWSSFGPRFLLTIDHILTRIKTHFSPAKIATGITVYMIVIFFISIPFHRAANLSNWKDTYPLLIGNETTGNRPWRGSVTGLIIADVELSADEVESIVLDSLSHSTFRNHIVTAFRLTDCRPTDDKSSSDSNFVDLAGNVPALTRRSQPPDYLSGQKPHPISQTWLETVAPATALTHTIRDASQFTIAVTVQTQDTAQFGPARILSLSEDTLRRNFMLAQKGCDIVVRLRTPLTGENGTKPQLTVPAVFDDRQEHRIVVTYDGETLVVHVDGRRQPTTLSLSPVMAAMGLFSTPNAHNSNGYRAVYFGLVFFPVGFLLGIVFGNRGGYSRPRGLLIVASLLLPLAWEILTTVAGNQRIDFRDVTLGAGSILIAAGLTICIVKFWLFRKPAISFNGIRPLV